MANMKNYARIRPNGQFAFFLVILAFVLAACTPEFGPSFNTAPQAPDHNQQQNLSSVIGEKIGNGPVRVAMLLPITADGVLGRMAISLRNTAQLALDRAARQNGGQTNITLIVKDTAGDPATAQQQASQAIAEGARLILGPIRGNAVRQVGAVAKSANVPVIGFSNNAAMASAGVYLLNILPDTQVERGLSYAKAQGRRAFGAILPANGFGDIMNESFRSQAQKLGIQPVAILTFDSEQSARQIVQQLALLIKDGTVDALFMPDQATASSLAVLLETQNVDPSSLTIIGSASWDDSLKVNQTAFLTGAVYPTTNNTDFEPIKQEFRRRFGVDPHPISSFGFTAVFLANDAALSQSNPPYARRDLTKRSGFRGIDGLFRFFSDGTNDMALAIMRVQTNGNQLIDPAPAAGAAFTIGQNNF